MRTRQEYQYAYNGLTTAEFGERVCMSAEKVRELIDAGWFRGHLTSDGQPECLNIASPNAKQPTFRIHPTAIERFYRERAA